MLALLLVLLTPRIAPQAAPPEPTVLPEVVSVAPVSEGRVTLDCWSTSAGRLSDCRIIEETPRGRGFGEAALRAARDARFGAASDARVRFTIRYVLDPGQEGAGGPVDP